MEIKSDDELTIHSLNIQGTFFHRWCIDVINRYSTGNLKVITYELPVEYPLSSDIGVYKPINSRLDIFARLRSRNSYQCCFDLVIECKKNNPEFVDWVFFPTYTDRKGKYRLIKATRIGSETTKQHYSYGLIIEDTTNYDVVDEGWETRGKYQQYRKPDRTKTINSSIFDACNQVIIATHYLASKISKEKSDIKPIYGDASIYKHVFLPMIITTANIKVLAYKPSDVSGETGEIELEKTKITQVDSLIYNFPIPANIQFDYTIENIQSEDYNLDNLNHMSVLIVNSSAFVNELTKLPNILEYLLT